MSMEASKRRVEGRSPSFPAISLPEAIDQARKLYESHKTHAVPLSLAAKAWGVSETSSAVLALTAALKAFGLVTDSGSGKSRTIRISDEARKILTNPPSDVRRELLRKFFLTPQIVRTLFQEWGAEPPARETAEWELTNQRGFTREAARRFYAMYRESIEFLARENALPSLAQDAGLENSQGQASWLNSGDVAPNPGPTRGTSVGATGAAAWEERIVDETGVEIVVRFAREPSRNSFQYLRDYLDFKIRRMTSSAGVSGQAGTVDPLGCQPEDLS